MFEPGHLHRANTIASGDMPLFSVDLFYEVRQDPNEGPMLHMRLQGQVNGQAFEEVFELHRDTAFNFASAITRIAGKHGLHPNFGPVLRNHKEYDLMFEDIRNKLKAVPGEPVNLDHLLKDGF